MVLTLRTITVVRGGARVVDRVSVEVKAGEIVGVLGLNGAGKTSLFLASLGILPTSGGLATFEGLRAGEAARQGLIGYVDGGNIVPEPAWSVSAYLAYVARTYKLPLADAASRARELIEKLSLSRDAERPIGELSGGMQRKVELARALMPGPRLLFLDEPTRELDLPSKGSAWSLVEAEAKNGAAVVLASHDPYEIARLCERVIVLRRGRVVLEQDRTARTPTPEFISALSRAMTLAELEPAGHKASPPSI